MERDRTVASVRPTALGCQEGARRHAAAYGLIMVTPSDAPHARSYPTWPVERPWHAAEIPLPPGEVLDNISSGVFQLG